MSVESTGDEDILRGIALRASTLWERLDGPYVPASASESTRLATERLGKWREKAAGGSPELFEERLSWRGITSRRALEVLDNLRLEGPLPPWTRTFERALQATREPARGGRAYGLPFEEVLRPFADAGVAMLETAARAPFTREAFDTLVGDLMRELSYTSAPTFLREFTRFRAQHGDTNGTPSSRKSYDTFTARLLERGLWRFFSEYAVLARLLSQIVEMWARNVSELSDALAADRQEIQRVFTGGAPVGRVIAIEPSLSDRHNGGRSVACVEFESGLRLFYKPRSLGIEKSWYSLLQHLNARGADFRILRVLDRGRWGWAEPAEHAPCLNAQEARRFYVRAGMLLAVLYVLDASDCFYENIVASGPYPVLIDMEALMHHVLERGPEPALAEQPVQAILLNSVFRTGLLPSWDIGPGGECVDISGLGATAGQVTSYLKRRWKHVNTDAMALEHEPIQVSSENHLPRLEGVPLRASHHAPEIVEGFQMMYRLLAKHREELASPEGPLAELGARELRIIFHATRLYSLILKRLCAPRHMRSGVERSIETDIISRFYLGSEEKSRYWPVLDAELEAMERLDLPFFTVRADSPTLSLPTGRVLEHAIKETGIARVWRRLASLHETDLELQTRFIQASLSLAMAPLDPRPRPKGKPGEEEDRPLSRDELLAEAVSIATRLEEQAIFLESDGGVTWIAPQPLPGSGHHQLRPLRMDLYNGLAGLALFFAALESVSGRGRRVARAALSTLRRFVSTVDARRAAQAGYGIGAIQGAGSFIYTLCRCAPLLDEPALYEDAARAANLIVPEGDGAHDTFDVMSGSAGALIGLLTLYEATGNGEALGKAVLCGEHLLKNQYPAERDGAAWRMKGRLLTGFSHGAAGIALALLRLHATTGDARFRKAAEKAMAFEDSVFVESEGNWPDFRSTRKGASDFMNTWCHGAAGIGIARASGLALLDSPAARRDIDTALLTVIRQGQGDKDGLCCGDLGKTDLVLLAARLKGDTDLEELAVRRASMVVRRARAGGYRFSGPDKGEPFDPSFFQGLSGVGYQLLRLAFPRRLSSVLALE
ncbi:type 2 lantipeptide synthetase LanM [Cystobacter fuscus]|uniref:type 2 lanthipeptide synthetase LanM family protein n=1 Tax=Cystobacter fuscus TaxID=43 RepID=UPI002B2D30D4|nr:type 2 lantipeptide synthetase LanM [Cystobacter fuscus]